MSVMVVPPPPPSPNSSHPSVLGCPVGENISQNNKFNHLFSIPEIHQNLSLDSNRQSTE